MGVFTLPEQGPVSSSRLTKAFQQIALFPVREIESEGLLSFERVGLSPLS